MENPGAKKYIINGMITWKSIINMHRKMKTLIVIILKNFMANILPFCFNNLEYIGNKAEVKAPSALTLLNKLGNLKAIKKMSEKIPAPKKAATNISLMKPDIRLKNVSIADWVKPLIKKEVLSFIQYLKILSFDLLDQFLLKPLK